jgi:hypothetical protein
MNEPFFKKYTDLVPEQAELCPLLRSQTQGFTDWLGLRTEEESLMLHSPYTWSLREVVNHLADCERVFAFRLLWIARGGPMPLVCFDEHEFSRRAQANDQSLSQLTSDFLSVRSASLTLFDGLPKEVWQTEGQVGEDSITVEKQASILIGHVEHH